MNTRLAVLSVAVAVVTLPVTAGGWGQEVNGLACAIASFEPTVSGGGNYSIEVSIKNVSTQDIVLVKYPYTHGIGQARLHLRRNGSDHKEFFLVDIKSFLPRGVTADDFARLKPNQIYAFTHKTYLALPGDNMPTGSDGVSALPEPGTYDMQFRYAVGHVRITDKLDSIGLTPWKGSLASAWVTVQVRSADRTAAKIRGGTHE